jgi:predicted membrane-bound spermidine synthase
MTRRDAVIVDCPGLQDGVFAHAMRDGCWSCAPYWEHVPTCPDCGVMLCAGKGMNRRRSDRCPQCHKFFNTEVRS